ncbi:MAG: putative Zn-dependent protease [Planctomycetota bacterium]|jgi:predicted Zn-dependent protease
MTSLIENVTARAPIGRATKTVYRGTTKSPRSRLRLPILAGASLLIALGGASCKNINTYSLDDDINLGSQAYAEVTKSDAIITSGLAYERVQRVTERLIKSANEMKPDIAPHFEWEVVVIDSPDTINAFCLPGGKMAVYTGILGVAQGDAGLAVVMGHEIAHATERHGTERLTRTTLMDSAITVMLENEDHQAVATVVANFGIGMPWGRTDESEADIEGLMILANAGYDPREAPKFWERMAAASSGGSASGNSILAASSIDEFMSTHPSNETRIADLTAAIPAAMPLYEAANRTNP